MKMPGGRSGILSLSIKDKAVLYSAYMPFITNGGLFIPTEKQYKLGEEIFLGVGNGAPGQVANLMAFNEAYIRQSTKALVQTGEALLSGEGPGFDENDPRLSLIHI